MKWHCRKCARALAQASSRDGCPEANRGCPLTLSKSDSQGFDRIGIVNLLVSKCVASTISAYIPKRKSTHILSTDFGPPHGSPFAHPPDE